MMTSFDHESRRNRAFGFGRKPNTTLFPVFHGNVKGKQEEDDDDDYEDDDGYEDEDG